MRWGVPVSLLWLFLVAAYGQGVAPGPSAFPLNVRNGCGGGAPAIGNGIIDDSAALAACITTALTMAAQASPQIVYIPAGTYLIKATSLPMMAQWGIRIEGQGSHKTFIKVDPSYVGDVFAWDEAWLQNALTSSAFNPAVDRTGAAVVGLTISGDTTSANVQNALAFYDRDDLAYIQDVSVFSMHGSCLKTGATKTQSVAYMRESTFFSFTCFNAGTSTQAAVEISSTSVSGSDATNELHFFWLEIFGAVSTGLLIHNPNNFNATRLIDFYGLRVEDSGADNIDVGLLSDAGPTNQIYIYGFESISPGGPNSGFYGANLGLGAVQDYDIRIAGGEIGPCIATTCYGLRVDNVRLGKIEIGIISSTGANVTYTSRTGGDIVLDASGLETSFTYSVPGTVTAPALNTFTP